MNLKQWIANSLVLPDARIDEAVDANLLGIGAEKEDDDQGGFAWYKGHKMRYKVGRVFSGASTMRRYVERLRRGKFNLAVY
ncbi:hypothetical protein L3X38_021842 [Prunus dulcis]|uniref:Uncharacterized protein n=1 Tax=Prunus dulcis TaxID=3755 RepID=A0AAD4Z3U2_PRUDU|nr:hypothetical protein L3X38_021842 [Prunus dulcis]